MSKKSNNASAEKIGALWQMRSSKQIYWTGTIEIDGKEIKIAIFENRKRRSEKHPDFYIYRYLQDKPEYIKKKRNKRNESDDSVKTATGCATIEY